MTEDIDAHIKLYAEKHGITIEAAEAEMMEKLHKKTGTGIPLSSQVKPNYPFLNEPVPHTEFLSKIEAWQKSNELRNSFGKAVPQSSSSIDKIKAIMEAAGDMQMNLMIFKNVFGQNGFGQEQPQKPAVNIEEAIAKALAQRDETWSQRIERDRAAQRETELFNKIHTIEALIPKKGEDVDDKRYSALTDELNKMKIEQARMVEQRYKDDLDRREKEHAETKEMFKKYQEKTEHDILTLRMQEPPKSGIDALMDEANKQKKFNAFMTEFGKTQGWSNDRINKEIESGSPTLMDIISTATQPNGIIFKLAELVNGNKNVINVPANDMPEIAEPEVASSAICQGCGNPSDNGTEYCNACRALAESQQKKAQEDAEAKARQRGEIPGNSMGIV